MMKAIAAMKIRYDSALLCLAAMLLYGCASRNTGPAYHAGDENPPDFLGGPVAVVLTNLNGFSAHVTSTISSPGGKPQTTSGELLGREGRLLFQPTLSLKSERARTEAGWLFVWDETKHSGYVMSEALQGYAPIEPDIEAAGPLNITEKSSREDVNGHPCHQCEGVVLLNNGLEARLTLWQADDVKHFPVRIEAANGPNRMTLDFSEIRLETPARELFLPPDGFIAYVSSTALINELLFRDANVAQKHKADDIHPSNWHDTPSVAPYGHQ